MKPELPSWLEHGLRPLDAARRAVVRTLVRSPRLRAFSLSKEHRSAAILATHACAAFAVALFAPVLLFVFGPVVAGVPHVAADFRYLVLRRALPRAWLLIVLAAAAALVLLRTLEEAGVTRNAGTLETLCVAGWAWTGIAFAAAGGARVARDRRAVIAATSVALGLVLALAYPAGARLVFLHAHNLVAAAVWFFLFRSHGSFVLLALAGVLAFAGLLASGAASELALSSPAVSLLGIHVLQMTDWLAPGLPLHQGVGLSAAYVFLQSIHYALWLFVIPHEELPARGTQSFRTSARELARDFGAPGLALVVLATLAVWLGACFAIHRARTLYVSLATFHGYLELVMLAYFWVRAAPMRARDSSARLAAAEASAVT